MGIKGSKDREIFIQKQVTEEPVHDYKHIGRLFFSNCPLLLFYLRNLHRVGGLGAFRPSPRSLDRGLDPARPYEVNVPILTRLSNDTPCSHSSNVKVKLPLKGTFSPSYRSFDPVLTSQLPFKGIEARSLFVYMSAMGFFHERMNSLFASYSSFLDD